MRGVQLLNWKLKTIEELLPDIHKQGFDTIQINPMQKFKYDKFFRWWLSYQPLGFELGNMFGDKNDLSSLTATANDKYGIRIITDVVANHAANANDEDCLMPHETVDESLRDDVHCWKWPKVLLSDGDDRKKAVSELIGLPGLDLNNEKVKQQALNYLKELKDCGVGGFRFDAAKHIGLPSDGVDFFEKVKDFVSQEDLYAYAEFLGGNQKWRDEFTKYMDLVTGFKTKVSDKNKHVAYIESHDTYLNNDSHSTRNITISQLDGLYDLLTDVYPKTLHYVRALKYPYLTDGEHVEDFGKPFSSINETEYFDTSFLDSKRIRECNEKLLLKRRKS